MDWLQALWAGLADPNVAYLLLVGGILAAVAAWSTPGTGLAEGLAALMLGLALIGLLRLPVSAAGLFLILLGALLFLSELYFQSGGYLGLSGALAMGLGGLFLFPAGAGRRVAPLVLLGTTAGAAAASFGLAVLVRRLGRRPPLQTPERLIGAEGIAQTDLDPEGTVWVRGETWTARAAAGRIAAGERVRVLAVEGLRLRVARVQPPVEASDPASEPKGPAAIGGGMAVLLAVHLLAFLESHPLSRDPTLRMARPTLEPVASRPVGEQAVFGLLLALGWITLSVGMAALLWKLRGARRALSAAMLAGLGLTLLFSTRLLLVSLLGPIPEWALLFLAGPAVLLLRSGRRRPGGIEWNGLGLLMCSAASAYLGHLWTPDAWGGWGTGVGDVSRDASDPGHLWTPVAVAVVLGVMILYDVLAVYVSRHMVQLAEWAIRERLPLLFLLPPALPPFPSKGPTLALGFGDVALPTALTLSAFHAHPTPWPAAGALVGVLVGHALLAGIFLPRWQSHAGLPFLAGGALLGYGAGRLLEQAIGG